MSSSWRTKFGSVMGETNSPVTLLLPLPQVLLLAQNPLLQLLLSKEAAVEAAEAAAVMGTVVVVEAQPTTPVLILKIKIKIIEGVPLTEALIEGVPHPPPTNKNLINEVQEQLQMYQITRAPVTGPKVEMRNTAVIP